MIPYPAMDPTDAVDRLSLVTCRFPTAARVAVHGSGDGWPVDWARAAVEGVDRRVEAIELVLDPAADESARPHARIEVAMVDVSEKGPTGLGDTLGRCDVGTADPDGRPRGVMLGAEIRMRRAQIVAASRLREATAEEWVGALMHELGHALGYAGHAALGESIVVRDETHLRLAGRRALRGESDRDATLEALYALPMGQRLGVRAVSDEGRRWLESLRALRRARVAAGDPVAGVVATVGDVAARLVWRFEGGAPLVVRMPDWRGELRRGVPITLRPDAATRAVLAARTVAEPKAP